MKITGLFLELALIANRIGNNKVISNCKGFKHNFITKYFLTAEAKIAFIKLEKYLLMLRFFNILILNVLSGLKLMHMDML